MDSNIQDTKADKLFKVFNYGLLTFALIVVLYPLLYVISASISDPAAVNSGKMWLFPVDITWEGYRRVFNTSEIWVGYRNTIFYTLLGTSINLAVTLPAAYALSRKDFVGRNFFMAMFVITMFLSGGLIPTYLLIRDLGMVNSIWAMVLPNAAAIWNIIICRTFFQSTIPKELEEAATIDGCSIFNLFFRIILPLSAPIIAVMALFYGVGHWNQYFNAMIYLSDASKYPLQLVLRQILVLQEMASTADSMTDGVSGVASANQAEIAAVVRYAVMIVATLPVIIIYPLMQRYFVKGVMIGSLKG